MQSYFIFIIPIVVAAITQLIKVLTDLIKGNFNFSSLYKYGGMPSGHTAFVASALTMTWFTEGWNSPIFALTILLSIIVIRDAVSLRAYMGQHSKIINRLIRELPDEKEYSYPILEERIGHTPLQVLAGFATGIILTVIAIYIIQ